MKPIRIILCTFLLMQVACHGYVRPDACPPPANVDRSFDLKVEDRGSFLLISVHNKSKGYFDLSPPPNQPDILSTRRTRKESIVCLDDDPDPDPWVRVNPGEAIEFKLEKKAAAAEIERIKSSQNFRFLYKGLYGGAYSGVCSMDDNSKIECP